MEELDLKDLFKFYLRKWYIIGISIILAIVAGIYYIKELQVPMYESSTTIILVQSGEDNPNKVVNQSDLALSEKLVATYTTIIKSRRVLDPVIENLELNETYNELKNKVSVSSVSNTSIIEISIKSKNSKDSMIIANEIANVFKEEISKIYNLENISIIDKAIINKTPYNINLSKQLVIYSLVAIVLSCSIIFVVYYFDNTIKSKKEVELLTNLAVLGEIPTATRLKKYKKKNKREENKIIDVPVKKSTKVKTTQTKDKKKTSKKGRK